MSASLPGTFLTLQLRAELRSRRYFIADGDNVGLHVIIRLV